MFSLKVWWYTPFSDKPKSYFLWVISPIISTINPMDNPYLVGGLEHFGNVIIPTDELIFFRGVRIPPTNYGQTPTKSPWFLVTPPLNHHEPPPLPHESRHQKERRAFGVGRGGRHLRPGGNGKMVSTTRIWI